MKINDRMRYPHPVLSEYSSDYVSGAFRCAFDRNLTEENELRIEAMLELDSEPLVELIEQQKAAIGYFLICRPTYFNRLQPVPIGKSEKFFDADKLFGTVQIRPAVWTLEEIDDFESDLIDDEFGDSVAIAKGSVIAMGPEFRFSMDRKKYKPFDSIFELAKDDTVPESTFLVDHSRDRITILASGRTFDAIAGMRKMPVVRSLLLSSVYMPTVMEVVARLQAGESMEGNKWYRVFAAKCDDLGIDPADEKNSPLDIAQKLLRQPINKVISVVENL